MYSSVLNNSGMYNSVPGVEHTIGSWPTWAQFPVTRVLVFLALPSNILFFSEQLEGRPLRHGWPFCLHPFWHCSHWWMSHFFLLLSVYCIPSKAYLFMAFPATRFWYTYYAKLFCPVCLRPCLLSLQPPSLHNLLTSNERWWKGKKKESDDGKSLHSVMMSPFFPSVFVNSAKWRGGLGRCPPTPPPPHRLLPVSVFISPNLTSIFINQIVLPKWPQVTEFVLQVYLSFILGSLLPSLGTFLPHTLNFCS